MGIRDLLCIGKKKKVKHLGSKHKPDGTGSDVEGEITNTTSPSPQPGPYVVADDGGGNGVDADGQKAGSTDQPPQPDELEPMPANRGEIDQGGGEADVGGRKVGPMYSHPHPDIEVGVGSGPGREGVGVDGEEGGQIYSRSSAPSIPHSGEPDGALMWSFELPHSSLPQAT